MAQQMQVERIAWESATRSNIEWRVGQYRFKTRWAAKLFAGSHGDEQMLADLRSDGQVLNRF